MSAGHRPDSIIAVLGATGITGRVALAHLQERAEAAGITVRAGGRDPDRIRALCARRGIPVPQLVRADVEDPASLDDLLRGAAVLINLAGPYTRLAPPVLAACLRSATHYLDLTGEPQLVIRTDRDLHSAAKEAGIALVHTAGFEALPMDVLTDLARRAAAARGHQLRSADLEVSVTAAPGAGLLDAVSGGTIQSLLASLADPEPPRMADVAVRIPADGAAPGTAGDADEVRAASPLVLRARFPRGRALAPQSPLATINPPVIHRTQALSPVPGAAQAPLAYREAMSLGAATPAGRAAAHSIAAAQRGMVRLSRLPHPLRAAVAAGLGRVLPASGEGPGQDVDAGWSWSIRGTFTTHQRTVFEASWEATGNPGYGTTPRMVAELAIRIARRGVPEAALGSSTPALALDGDVAALRPAGAEIRLI
ncbi:saccharopine dehydrogenase NADP-binding domain-containing protein [Brachybacterium sp. UNK5269]|uniref:saccharopine dehydrogenase NADP-binding domain-containing protein n=1 Tax=Brachybacterium sp. UNK5269 TaxID=3408576 RepID=UPI003BB18B82